MSETSNQLDSKIFRPFPLLMCFTGQLKSVPWGFVAQYETQIYTNHGQTLQHLADRGGLAPSELLAASAGLCGRDVLAFRTNMQEAAAAIGVLAQQWTVREVLKLRTMIKDLASWAAEADKTPRDDINWGKVRALYTAALDFLETT